MSEPLDHTPEAPVYLLYDGACPMCSAFAGFACHEGPGGLEKINARDDTPLRTQATNAAMNLDDGIVVAHGGQLYYGAEALSWLARQKQESRLLTLLYLPFRSGRFSRLAYPLLVQVRRLLLWCQNKPLIDNLRPKP